jgi:hypothetical protein
MNRILVFIVMVFALSACGNREEIAEGKRSYQGKPDSPSWNNEPQAAEYRGGKWTGGDRASWEADIKARQLTQNEYKRIEGKP